MEFFVNIIPGSNVFAILILCRYFISCVAAKTDLFNFAYCVIVFFHGFLEFICHFFGKRRIILTRNYRQQDSRFSISIIILECFEIGITHYVLTIRFVPIAIIELNSANQIITPVTFAKCISLGRIEIRHHDA